MSMAVFKSTNVILNKSKPTLIDDGEVCKEHASNLGKFYEESGIIFSTHMLRIKKYILLKYAKYFVIQNITFGSRFVA